MAVKQCKCGGVMTELHFDIHTIKSKAKWLGVDKDEVRKRAQETLRFSGWCCCYGCKRTQGEIKGRKTGKLYKVRG